MFGLLNVSFSTTIEYRKWRVYLKTTWFFFSSLLPPKKLLCVCVWKLIIRDEWCRRVPFIYPRERATPGLLHLVHFYTWRSTVVSNFTKLPVSGESIIDWGSCYCNEVHNSGWISSMQTYLHLPITDYVTPSAPICRHSRITPAGAVSCLVSMLSGIGYALSAHSGSARLHLLMSSVSRIRWNSC